MSILVAVICMFGVFIYITRRKMPSVMTAKLSRFPDIYIEENSGDDVGINTLLRRRITNRRMKRKRRRETVITLKEPVTPVETPETGSNRNRTRRGTRFYEQSWSPALLRAGIRTAHTCRRWSHGRTDWKTSCSPSVKRRVTVWRLWLKPARPTAAGGDGYPR